MPKPQPSIEEVIEFLNSLGYIGKYDEIDGCYIISTKKIRIGIFPENYRIPKLAGHVAAESQKTFDKWATVYYCVKFPSGKRARKRMERSLEEICAPEHIERSNTFQKHPDND